MFKTIIHIGRTVFDFSQGEDRLLDAVREAEARYASLDVSGVTIITPRRFAQLFEGSPETVDNLFAAVRLEWPGADMRVVEERLTQDRRFLGWKMAYYGPSSYIERHIEHLADNGPAADDKPVIQQLRRLVEEFAAQAQIIDRVDQRGR